ncbi:MAG: HD domain-containing protein [Desulfobacter sp.]|nr:MAG: HD domain-containing protein [Desulfobacter sp.]
MMEKSGDHLFFPLAQLSKSESIFSGTDREEFSIKYKPIMMPILGKQLAVNTYYANDLIAAANTPITIELLRIFDDLKINFKVNRYDVTHEDRDHALDLAMAEIIQSKRSFLDQLDEQDFPAIQTRVETFLKNTLGSPKIKQFENHFQEVKGYLQMANSAISSDQKFIGTAAALDRIYQNEKEKFKLKKMESGETIDHIIKTCWLSLIIADALEDFDEKECETLSIICMGHDGGKCLIPKDILYKQGRHTQIESDIMKSHVLLSYILSSDNQHRPSLESFAMALHHQKENPDLPQSYSILEECRTSFYQYLTPEAQNQLNETYHLTKKYYRVISIADTFEAISAERVYKKASSIGKTLKIMLKEDKNNNFFYTPYLNAFIKVLLNRFFPHNLLFTISNEFIETFLASNQLSPQEKSFYKSTYKGIIINSCSTLDQTLDCVVYNIQNKNVVHNLKVSPDFFLDQIYL